MSTSNIMATVMRKIQERIEALDANAKSPKELVKGVEEISAYGASLLPPYLQKHVAVVAGFTGNGIFACYTERMD